MDDEKVRAAVLKSKGLQTLDDLDGDEPQLAQLQSHHVLIVIVELCEAQRPSKLGSLKGTHEKYEEEFSRLEDTLSELRGEGELKLVRWDPTMGSGPGSSVPVMAAPTGSGRWPTQLS